MDAAQDIIYRLIQLFVQRQQLPYEVIRKYRPYLLDWNVPRPSKAYIAATGMGYWGLNDEWKYFLHGGGCRLIHTITDEIIEWDAPDLNRIDPYWFVHWLMWYLEYNPNDEATSILSMPSIEQIEVFRMHIFDLLDQLYRLGKLRFYPQSTMKYGLAL